MSDLLFFIPLKNQPSLSLSAVDEILTAVRYTPLDINHEMLARELTLAPRWQTIKFLFSKSRMAAKAKLTNEVVDEAEKLLDLLRKVPSNSLSTWTDTILKLAQDARREAVLDVPCMELRVSAIEWLIGEHLAGIYTRVFGRKAATSKDPYTGQIGGPFVRFIEAVLQHNGICTDNGSPYTKSTIAQALKRVREARSEMR